MIKSWRIVFYGEILEGHTLNGVKTRLADVFKLTHDKVNKIFSGQEYVISKDIPEEKLKEYVTTLEKMGLKVYPLAAKASEPDLKDLTTQAATPEKPAQNNDVLAPPTTKINLSDEIVCPHCLSIQPRRTLCRQCGLDMPRYRERKAKNKDYHEELELPPPLLGFSSDGRWDRISYLSSWFIIFFIYVTGRVLSEFLVELDGLGKLNYVLGVLFLAPIVFGGIKYQERIFTLRLHDLGLNRRWLIGMICLGTVGIIFWPLLILYLLFILYTFIWPGQKRANDYGPPVRMGSLPILIACIVIFLSVQIIIYDDYEPVFRDYLQRVKPQQELGK